ncbi:hypothetical protein J7J26_01970 [Candidatus Micrarchaeota archaeon]|nr:hypothetical protein [Candidatus Micrarchaeota archaeon]
MIKSYVKGSRAERELVKIFQSNGYSVIRAAGSGNDSMCPDLLAFKTDKQYGFESKSWKRNVLNLKIPQVEGLFRWKENTGITTMVAWKIPRVGWRFIPIELLNKNKKGYSINKTKALELYTIDEII